MGMVTVTCIGCGKVFEAKYRVKLQKYCSMKCRTTSTDEIVKCAQCGKEFKTKKCAHNKYCSISCGVTARNLTSQNPSYHRDVSGDKNPMYGKPGLVGEKNPMYGKRKENLAKKRKDGYILVRAPDGHPHPADTSSGTNYILEHRLVMEKHLGRFLDPAEAVHHIDGNPSNNSIENLQLFANQSDHIHLGHKPLGKKRGTKLRDQ